MLLLSCLSNVHCAFNNFLWHTQRSAFHLNSLVGFRNYLSTFFENQDRCPSSGIFFFIYCNFLYSNDYICNCLWVPGMPCVQVLKGEHAAGSSVLSVHHTPLGFSPLLLSALRNPKVPSPKQILPLYIALCSLCFCSLGLLYFANHRSYRSYGSSSFISGCTLLPTSLPSSLESCQCTSQDCL